MALKASLPVIGGILAFEVAEGIQDSPSTNMGQKVADGFKAVNVPLIGTTALLTIGINALIGANK